MQDAQTVGRGDIPARSPRKPRNNLASIIGDSVFPEPQVGTGKHRGTRAVQQEGVCRAHRFEGTETQP